ncbi:MAG: hypothetical protein LBJ32_04640 [Oscillospiraceae bacterium]|jgi:hypothetical protein|nr:hypothetical protein [Oscillospiraceae bacterium]
MKSNNQRLEIPPMLAVIFAVMLIRENFEFSTIAKLTEIPENKLEIIFLVLKSLEDNLNNYQIYELLDSKFNKICTMNDVLKIHAIVDIINRIFLCRTEKSNSTIIESVANENGLGFDLVYDIYIYIYSNGVLLQEF